MKSFSWPSINREFLLSVPKGCILFCAVLYKYDLRLYVKNLGRKFCLLAGERYKAFYLKDLALTLLSV